jgi:hypothetical protein
MGNNANGRDTQEEGSTMTVITDSGDKIMMPNKVYDGIGAQAIRTAKGERERQRSFFQEYPDLDEHVGLAERRAREMVEQLTDELGMVAATSSSMKMATQYYTPRGVLMDQVVTVKVDIKPAKPEKE